MPASAWPGGSPPLPRERQLEMIDLNIRALTELCRSGAAGDDRAADAARSSTSRRPPPSRPGPTWRSISRPRPMSSPSPRRFTRRLREGGEGLSALCPGPTATEFGRRRRLEAARLSPRLAADPVARRRGGPQGPRAEPGGGHSRARQQDRRPEQPLPAARAMRRIDRPDQNLAIGAGAGRVSGRLGQRLALEQASRTASRGRSCTGRRVSDGAAAGEPVAVGALDLRRRTAGRAGRHAPPSNGFRA